MKTATNQRVHLHMVPLNSTFSKNCLWSLMQITKTISEEMCVDENLNESHIEGNTRK